MPEKPDGPELVVAVVGALGSPLQLVTDALGRALQEVGYESRLVSMSGLLHEFRAWADLPRAPLDKYVESHQDAGDELRTRTKRGDALACLAIGAIRKERQNLSGDAKRPASRTAYLIRSLKHPDEVALLRRVYGRHFFLVAAYAPREFRLNTLAEEIAQTHTSTRSGDHLPRAQHLISKDEAEASTFGQHVRDTFPLADIFINSDHPTKLADDVNRFIEIVFGHPFHTPTRIEFGMFHAQAAALRSAGLSRQVGAVICTNDGDVLALGANEVPKPGGGHYWPGDQDDGRDFQQARNESLRMRRITLGEVLDVLRDAEWLQKEKVDNHSSIDEIVDAILPLMANTQLMALGEFGRTVHAEMAVLLDAARNGTPVRDRIMFTTTFPCHNCTRHIIAAGIQQVFYISPYPKSHAERLHRDAIVVDSPAWVEGRVNFQPFVGIAPSRYIEFFTMPQDRTESGSQRAPKSWTKLGAAPRWKDQWASATYMTFEEAAFID